MTPTPQQLLTFRLPHPDERVLPTPLNEQILMWSVYAEEKGFYFNGYVLVNGGRLIIIDPPSATPEVFDSLSALGTPELVIITNREHERESDAFRQHFGLDVAAHQLDAPLLQVRPEQTFKDNDTLAGGLLVVHVPDQKSPGESVLYRPDWSLLIVGDALIGNPPGELSLLPAAKYADRRQAVQSLKRLADINLGLEVILTGDGEPIIGDAQTRLERFLIENS